MAKLPNLLVIGACKAGTTTLCSDLQLHPQVYFPVAKEPNCLAEEDVLAPRGRALYEAYYRGADAFPIRGDGSTTCTQLPRYPGVARKARELLGPDLKLIYIIREPLARVCSHHYHRSRFGLAPAVLDEALDQVGEILEYGRYATQVEPWIEEFGVERLRVVRFEDYIGDRQAVLCELISFLGLPPHDYSQVSRAKNVGDEQRVGSGSLQRLHRWLTRNHLFRTHLTMRIPDWFKNAVKACLLQAPPPRPAPPSAAARARVYREAAPELERLQALLGRSEPWYELPAEGAVAETDGCGREIAAGVHFDPSDTGE